MAKQHVSFRLSEETLDLVRLMADNLGVSQAAIIEMSVREKAGRHAKEGFAALRGFVRSLSPELKAEFERKMAEQPTKEKRA